MRPTRASVLLGLAVLSGVLAYAVFRLRYSTLPPVPVTATFSTFALAVCELFLAPSIRARLAGKPRTKPIMPIAVARTAALAKASSALGALAGGGWAGVLVYVLPRLDLVAARRDASRSVAGLVVAVLLVIAALRLEGVCRVPRPPDAEEP